MIIPKVFDIKNINSGFYTKKDSDLIESFDLKQVCYCHQIHSDISIEAKVVGFQGDGDAVWTMKKGLKCIVRVADCVPILFHSDLGEIQVVGVIHSGWQGTVKNIVGKTFEEIYKKVETDIFVSNDFFENIKIWIGPSICQDCYEFGKEAEILFESKYLKKTSLVLNHGGLVLNHGGKKDFFLVDVKGKVIDQLFDMGILAKNIEVSDLCTFEDEKLCYSWRRGKDDGRMIAWIELKK